jgi:hypothetical protein
VNSKRILIFLVVGIFLVGKAFWKRGGAGKASSELKKALATSQLEPLKKILLAFEKKYECQTFSPCFYASVDGARARDPQKAVDLCTKAMNDLQSASVPTDFPPAIQAELQTYLRGHQWSAENFKIQAENHIHRTRKKIPTVQTCDSYATIDSVNEAFGVKSLMQGHYINCSVLDGMKDIELGP